MVRILAIFILFINFFTLSIGISFAGPKDRLKEAYTRSHNPGDGEPYSIDAEARDMFDTKIDLVETGKKLLKSKEDLGDAAKDLNNAIKDTENINNAIKNINKEIASLLKKGKPLNDFDKQKLKDLKNALQDYKNQLKVATNKLGAEISKATTNADSIFVRIARYLMKIAVILAVPVLFYVAIKLALTGGDKGKMEETVKQALYVLGGLLLALFSVMIVYLIISLTRSNVNFF